MDDIAVERAGHLEMREGAGVFARAMGRAGPMVEAWLFRFSMRLAEAGVGRFTVARHDNKIVGYGSLVTYRRLGWIGFMGTEPAFQGRGIGAAIMEHLLGLAKELDLKTLKLDATNVGKKLYSRFGFREEYPARRLEIPGLCARGTRRDGPGGGVKVAGRLPEWCLELDRRAFGDDRSPLIHAALTEGAKVLLAGKRGFGLLDGKKLGPIVATDTYAAIDILHCGSGLGAGVIYVPHHPELPSDFLNMLRLTEDEGPITCCTRMHLGEPLVQERGLAFADYSAATG